MAVNVHDKKILLSFLILCPESGKCKKTGKEVGAMPMSLKTGLQLFRIRGMGFKTVQTLVQNT